MAASVVDKGERLVNQGSGKKYKNIKKYGKNKKLVTGGIPSPDDDSWLEIEELRMGESPEENLFRVFWEKFTPGTKLLAHCQFPISKVRLFFKS